MRTRIDPFMPELIISIFAMMAPDLTWINGFSPKLGGELETGCIDAAFQSRIYGDNKPIVIVGFDKLERVEKLGNDFFSSNPDIFYLRLPCMLSAIRALSEEARSCEVLLGVLFEGRTFRRFAVGKLRVFKHTCDNIWMSMNANVSSAEKTLKNSPSTLPPALKRFKRSRLMELAQEYSCLAPLARHLEIKMVSKLPKLFSEVVRLIEQMGSKEVRPVEAVSLAHQCVEKMKTVATILAKARDIETSE